MNIVYIRRNGKSLCDGIIVMGSRGDALRHRCALGRSGLSVRKREGDGATPIGQYRMLEVFYRSDRFARPQTRLPVTPIQARLGWCDDPIDRNYNRMITLPYPASHEKLMRDDHLYDCLVVLDYNISVRKRFAGSAIFLHLARKNFDPTEGCIAVHETVMRRFLELANTDTILSIKA